MSTLRIATLNTRFHLTTAHRVRSCPLIHPNSISLHSCTLAPGAAVALKASRALAFTITPGNSPAPGFLKPITLKKQPTDLNWTWHGAITPSGLPVLPTDMSITIKTLLCSTREHRGLYLLISDSPPPRLSGSIRSTAPMAFQNK